MLFVALFATRSCASAFRRFEKRYSKHYATELMRNEAMQQFCVNYAVLYSDTRSTHVLGFNRHSDRAHPPLSYKSARPPEKVIHLQQPLHEERVAADSLFTTRDILNYNRQNLHVVRSVCASLEYRRNDIELTTSNYYTVLGITADSTPEAVDLRKDGLVMPAVDQGTCGSCWAQTARNVLHTLVLHDLYYYYHYYAFPDYNNTEVANFSTKTVFSVQYILNNSFGDNLYCGGGNFDAAIADVYSFRVPGVELDSKVPYSAFSESESAPLLYAPQRIEPSSQYNKNYVLNPIHWTNYDDLDRIDCNAEMFTIDVYRDPDVLKAVLARGIAVSGAYHAPFDGDTKTARVYGMYAGGVLDDQIGNGMYACTTYTSNHQVTFVGYGKYKGTPVWVLYNSWGTSWGVYGTFYVKIGSNAVCYESCGANFVLPRFYRFSDLIDDRKTAFNKSYQYKVMSGVIDDSVGAEMLYREFSAGATREKLDDAQLQSFAQRFSGKKASLYDPFVDIRWGMNGLDRSLPGEKPFEQAVMSTGIIVFLVIVASLAVCVLYFICVCLLKPPPKEVLKPQYFVLDDQVACEFNWHVGFCDGESSLRALRKFAELSDVILYQEQRKGRAGLTKSESQAALRRRREEDLANDALDGKSAFVGAGFEE